MGPQEIISALSLTDGDHHPQWIEDILGPQIIKSLTIPRGEGAFTWPVG